MHLFSADVIIIYALLQFCNSQTYLGYSYPVRSRTGYTYNQSFYNRPTSNRNTVQSVSSNTLSNPTISKSYYQQNPQRNYKQTTTGYYNPYKEQSSTSIAISGSRGSSYPYNQQSSFNNRNLRGYYSPTNSINHNAISSSSLTGTGGARYPLDPNNQNSEQTFSTLPTTTDTRGSSNLASDPINNKQYLTNSYKNNNKIDSVTSSYSNKLIQDGGSGKFRVSKADLENAKFAGTDNLESEEDGRTLHLKRKKLRRRRLGSLASPCFPYGRDAGNVGTPPPKEQGRFLWDVNVYNIYPQTSAAFSSNSYGCGGGLSDFGGLGGIGNGLLSDPIAQPYYPPGTGLANFLGLLAPGILQNSLAVTASPQLYADPIQQSQINDNYQNNEAQSDPEVDPNYRPQQVVQPIRRRPNRIYYDSVGAPPASLGDIVGGISTTVNGLIQQLSGNIQPVYG